MMLFRALFHFFRNSATRENGFSLVEAVVAIGISGVVVLGSSSFFESTIRGQRESEKQFWLAQRRLEFQGLLKSDVGWPQVLAANPDMACFAASTNCGAFAAPQPLKMTLDGYVLDGTDATLGMRSDGEFCTGYVNGAGSCATGIGLTWQAICDNAACLHAQPKMTIQFRAPGASLRTFELNIYRDSTLSSLDEVCQAMNGNLVGANCVIPPSNCDPTIGSFVLGFDGRGIAVCGRPNPGTCGGADVGVGFDPSGGIVCASPCP